MSKLVIDDTIERRISGLEKRLSQIERGTPRSISFVDGSGTVRARFGLQDDGSYGFRAWNSAGALVHNYTTT